MSLPLPPPRQVPVVPRPRHGELSASYLARVALANRTQWRTFAGLLGRPLFPLRMACLKHGYWLYRDGAGSRLPPVMVPEITKTQKRLERLSARYGMDAAVRAYELARYYLREDWRKGGSPFWESTLADHWYQRAGAVASAATSWLPSWAVHPECTALAVMFANPYWAERAVPVPDRRHRLFYQHMLAALGVDDWTRRTASIRGFGSLPDDIREQASWGRLLSDPEWGSLLPPSGTPRKIPFIDITDDYERSAA